MVGLILLAAAAVAAEPLPEALRLGRQLAESGTLASLLPLMSAKETEELVADHPELAAADKIKLRAAAQRVADSGRNRLMDATGRAYAERLSIADLKRMVRFQHSPAAVRYRAATPQVIVETMQSVGKLDFKAAVRAAFCQDTGKLCGR